MPVPTNIASMAFRNDVSDISKSVNRIEYYLSIGADLEQIAEEFERIMDLAKAAMQSADAQIEHAENEK